MGLASVITGVDTISSSTPFDPTVGGTVSLTVTLDGSLEIPFLPLSGSVFITFQGDSSNVWVWAKILAWDPSTLVLTLEILETSVEVSQTYDSWFISVLDGTPEFGSIYAIQGLRVYKNSSDPINDIDILPGSVLDSTGKIILSLETRLTKRLDALFAEGTNQGACVEVALNGTVSSAGLNVTGVGTTFQADLNPFTTPTLGSADFQDQYDAWLGAGSFAGENSIISTATTSALILGVTSDTTLSTQSNLGAAGEAFFRGGMNGTGGKIFFICIGMRDTDGYVDIFATAATPSGEPDKPTGYTFYRVIARVATSTVEIVDSTITQPIKALNGSTAWEVTYDDNTGHFGGDTTVQLAISALINYIFGFLDLPLVTYQGEPSLNNDKVLTDTATVTWDFSSPGAAKANAVSGGGGEFSRFRFYGTASDGASWSKPGASNFLGIRLWAFGPGGAGGGTSNNNVQGGGGGGGAACFKQIAAASLGSTETLAIGTGGVPGAAGANPGGAGNKATTFGAHVSAGAGSGGAANTGAGGDGGAATGGDLNYDGQKGGSGDADTGTGVNSGQGGGAGGSQAGSRTTVTSLINTANQNRCQLPYAALGGFLNVNANNAGVAGGRGGGGGSGGVRVSTNQAGGAGGDGLIVVEEIYGSALP